MFFNCYNFLFYIKVITSYLPDNVGPMYICQITCKLRETRKVDGWEAILKTIFHKTTNVVHLYAVADLRGTPGAWDPLHFVICITNFPNVPLKDVGGCRPRIIGPPNWNFWIRYWYGYISELNKDDSLFSVFNNRPTNVYELMQ